MTSGIFARRHAARISRTAFPHVLFLASGHQGVLLASNESLTVSRDRLFALEKIGYVGETLAGEHLADYVKDIILDTTGIDDFIAAMQGQGVGGAEINEVVAIMYSLKSEVLRL